MDGWMDEWMDGWMDGCMVGRVFPLLGWVKNIVYRNCEHINILSQL